MSLALLGVTAVENPNHSGSAVSQFIKICFNGLLILTNFNNSSPKTLFLTNGRFFFDLKTPDLHLRLAKPGKIV